MIEEELRREIKEMIYVILVWSGLFCRTLTVPLHTRLTYSNLSWSCFKGQVLCHYWLTHRQHPLSDWSFWEEGALGAGRGCKLTVLLCVVPRMASPLHWKKMWNPPHPNNTPWHPKPTPKLFRIQSPSVIYCVPQISFCSSMNMLECKNMWLNIIQSCDAVVSVEWMSWRWWRELKK